MPASQWRLCEDAQGGPRAAAQRPAEACAPRRKDYYDILKVPKGAADSVIKRSYRKLALQYHPVRPRRGPAHGRPRTPPARRGPADGKNPRWRAGQSEGHRGGEGGRRKEVCRHKSWCARPGAPRAQRAAAPACARCRERPRRAALSRGRRAAAAYEILSSDEKRRIYDRYGEDGLKQHDAQGGGGGGAADIFSQCARRPAGVCRPGSAATLPARRPLPRSCVSASCLPRCQGRAGRGCDLGGACAGLQD